MLGRVIGYQVRDSFMVRKTRCLMDHSRFLSYFNPYARNHKPTHCLNIHILLLLVMPSTVRGCAILLQKSSVKLISRRALSQFYCVKICGSTNFMLLMIVLRRILELQNCEKARRDGEMSIGNAGT